MSEEKSPELAGPKPNEGQAHSSVAERYFLPSSKYNITWSAQRLFRRLAEMCAMFVHAGVVVELAFTRKGRAQLRDVTPSMARSRFEAAGPLWKDSINKHGQTVASEKRCSKDDAESLLATREATEILPEITVVSGSPILTVGKDGKPHILKGGYNEELDGAFVTNGKVKENVSEDERTKSLLALVCDYFFASASDRTRALAAMLTPALVYGRLLGEAHVPMFLVEANKSQAGKGLLLEIIAAIYGERPKIVVPRNGGVGSSDEDFNATLLRGCPMIMWDNLRGELNSPHLESFLTAGGPFMVRGFRRAPVDVDPQRYVVLATSNGFKPTGDLENRMIKIEIYKQNPDYEFGLYNEELLGMIRARQPYYLGCVFSILSEWIRRGRPRTDESRHTFRDWAQSLDWILLNLCGRKARLLDYTEKQEADKADPLVEVAVETETEK
jgi:hypothetical protein